jgi:methylated-DNA-[protein]-cysteine S-methyltransferase
MTEALAVETLETPVGRLVLVASEAGLRGVLWPHEAPRGPSAGGPRAHAIVRDAAVQLHEYFAGTRRRFELPLDLRGTPFQLAAWRALAEIPYGETRTYGEQARRLGRPRAARAVGAANGRNPLSIVLPCHRLVSSGGDLTGYRGGLGVKRALLEREAAVARRGSSPNAV